MLRQCLRDLWLSFLLLSPLLLFLSFFLYTTQLLLLFFSFFLYTTQLLITLLTHGCVPLREQLNTLMHGRGQRSLTSNPRPPHLQASHC